MSESIQFECGCFVVPVIMGNAATFALACCVEHERPNQTIAGILGDAYEIRFEKKYRQPPPPESLEQQLEHVQRNYPDARFVPPENPAGFRALRLTMPLPAGVWNRHAVEVIIEIPHGFPSACPENAWIVDDSFGFSNGARHQRMPRYWRGTDMMIKWIGRVQAWNPNYDRLMTYVHVIRHALWRSR